jgi:predicted dehydrogenase
MGGIEANCRVSCTFANGARGEIRLSRDTQLRNEYRIRGTEGWLSWTPNDAEHLSLGFAGSALAMRATLHHISNPYTLALSRRPAWSFQQSFMAQIHNVVAAIRGDDVLAVPGDEGIRSLRVIETCYRQRSLLAMPWLNPDEHARARHLNQGQAADPAGAFTDQERSL